MIVSSKNIAVVTGGPGSGNTTLCDRLSREGISIGAESGLAILKRPHGHELRRRDPLSYSLDILKLDIENFKIAKSSSEPWLFDRGFADNAGFLDLMGLQKPNELDQACRNYRYAGPVFVMPPWRDIYHGDSDRIQDWEEAKATYVAVIAAWQHYGYELVELPMASVEQRALFVKQCLS